MITVVAKLKAKAGKEAELEKVVTETIPKVESEEGTTMYRFHKLTSDPTTFMFFETYTDMEALGIHGKTDYFKAMGKALAELLDGAPEIGVYQEIARMKE